MLFLSNRTARHPARPVASSAQFHATWDVLSAAYTCYIFSWSLLRHRKIPPFLLGLQTVACLSCSASPNPRRPKPHPSRWVGPRAPSDRVRRPKALAFRGRGRRGRRGTKTPQPAVSSRGRPQGRSGGGVSSVGVERCFSRAKTRWSDGSERPKRERPEVVSAHGLLGSHCCKQKPGHPAIDK